MVDITGSHSARIDLCVGIAFAQATVRGQMLRVDFVVMRLDIDEDEVHWIAALEVRPNVFLKNCFAALDDFFFAVTTFCCAHGCAPKTGFISSYAAPLLRRK